MVWQLLGIVGMFWLLSFVAALLLCSPALFKRLPRRRRLRLTRGNEVSFPLAGSTQSQRSSIWQYLLLPIFGPFMLALLVLVLIPAFAAMWLSVVCVNFRYCRRATYRALRQRRAVLPSCRSYPTALAVFARKIAASC